MEQQILQELNAISYALSKIPGVIQDGTTSSKNIFQQLNQIGISVEGINHNFSSYQSNFTNQPWFQFVVGSLITLLATFVFDYFKNKKQKKNHLYYLERLVVDQINMLTEVRETTKIFVTERLEVLLKNIDSNPGSAYSVDGIFFPLFSVRPLPDDVNRVSSGSGYIDNKIGKIYSLSNDLPHIINDMRLQLVDTLQRNEKIAFGKLNSAESQKKQYKANIQEYREMLVKDILGKNIPIYLKKLAETLVSIREKSKRSSLSWRIKFGGAWFKSKRSNEQIMEEMEAYFQPETVRLLESIEEIFKP